LEATTSAAIWSRLSGAFVTGRCGSYAPTCRLWPDEQEGPWLLVLFWQVINGRAECVGMDLTSAQSPHVEALGFHHRPEIGIPLQTSTLRDLKLSELVADARAAIAELIVADQAPVFTARQMRPRTVKRLETVAETYRRAWRQGKPPVKAVAKRLNVSNAAANSLVARARAVGMLPPTSPGVAAGSANAARIRGLEANGRADLPPPPDPAHKALAFALARALPCAYRRDADGVHHWDAPVLTEYLTAAGWRYEPDALNSAADDLDVAATAGKGTFANAAHQAATWLRDRADQKEVDRG
jgi:hypothetical protein